MACNFSPVADGLSNEALAGLGAGQSARCGLCGTIQEVGECNGEAISILFY